MSHQKKRKAPNIVSFLTHIFEIEQSFVDFIFSEMLLFT